MATSSWTAARTRGVTSEMVALHHAHGRVRGRRRVSSAIGRRRGAHARMSVSREKLYEEVWAEPMTTVALRYEVSSSFLARICERLNVPRPPRGHWPQVKVGKKNPTPPLPPAEPGDELEWVRDEDEPARQPV